MKYKLIDLKTKEENLCEKITIDGFDYYVSEYKIKKEGQYCIDANGKIFKDENHFPISIGQRMILCTNNPNIDIPQVVSSSMLIEKIANVLTSYLKFPEERRNGIILGYNISQETHPFSEEDMIEFAEWVDNMGYRQVANGLYKSINDEKGKLTKELFQLWKEQKN